MSAWRAYRTTILICSTVVIVALIGVSGWVTVHGASPEQLLIYVGQFLPGIIATSGALFKLASFGRDMDVIKEQTNGLMQEQMNDVLHAQTDDLKGHITATMKTEDKPHAN